MRMYTMGKLSQEDSIIKIAARNTRKGIGNVIRKWGNEMWVI